MALARWNMPCHAPARMQASCPTALRCLLGGKTGYTAQHSLQGKEVGRGAEAWGACAAKERAGKEIRAASLDEDQSFSEAVTGTIWG